MSERLENGEIGHVPDDRNVFGALANAKRWGLQAFGCARILSLAIAAGLSIHGSAFAQSLNEAITDQLKGGGPDIRGEACFNLAGPGQSPERDNFLDNAGPQLESICNRFVGGGNGSTVSPTSVGGAAGTTATSKAIVRRLQSLVGGEGELEPTGSPDAVAELFSGMSVFLSAQYEDLDKDPTTFEAGYDSDIYGITGGIEYRFNTWLAAGVAVNYNHWQGDFKGGGDFETDSVGPTAYAVFTPLPGLFAQTVFSYAYDNFDKKRPAEYTNEDNDTFPPGTGAVPFGPPHAKADYHGNEITASALVGYDYRFDVFSDPRFGPMSVGPFSIGPRVGVNYTHIDIDNYDERGTTGLELSYQNEDVDSLQSVVGAQASVALRFDKTVVVPQIFGDWTHEYENDQSRRNVRFVQDGRPNPQSFTYQTEKPDRNFYHFGGSITAVFDNGLQPFVSAQTLLGHSYLESVTVNAGLQMNF